MAKVVVIGITGEAGLWMVDLKSGTVTPFESPEGELAKTAALRKVGATVVKGVDFAIAVSTASEAAAGLHEVANGLHEVASGLHEG